MLARLTRSLDRALEPYREYGPILIRTIVGVRLLWGTADNVFIWHRMVDFSEFIAGLGFPWPLAGAILSAWSQFICGILFILGAFTRPAAAVMIVNFIFALLLAHIGRPFLENYDALVILFASGFLLLHGPGAVSVDERRHGRMGDGRMVDG